MLKREGILFSLVLAGALLVWGAAGTVRAEVNVNINIGPPPIVVSEPAEIVLIPQYGVYFVPGLSWDVFFYNGYWWSPRGDRWYRSSQYRGPWVVVQLSYVPGYLFKVPKNYRSVYKNVRPINYGQWKQNYGQSKKQEGAWQQRGGQQKTRGGGAQGRGRKH